MNFEFDDKDEMQAVRNHEAKEIEFEGSEFADEISTYKTMKKLAKNEKKTKKSLSKQRKKIKKLNSKEKQNAKKIENLTNEVFVLNQNLENFKKIAKDGLFKDLVYSEDVSERKRLISEIQRLEMVK